MNGDGTDEIWVYSQEDHHLLGYMGGPDLRDGDVIDNESFDIRYDYSSSAPDMTMLGPVGDFSGDGVSEMAAGYSTESTSTGGQMWLFSSEYTSGVFDADEDAMVLLKADDDDGNTNYGTIIQRGEVDIDGDGDADLIGADPGWYEPKSTWTATGSAYIYLSPLIE